MPGFVTLKLGLNRNTRAVGKLVEGRNGEAECYNGAGNYKSRYLVSIRRGMEG